MTQAVSTLVAELRALLTPTRVHAVTAPSSYILEIDPPPHQGDGQSGGTEPDNPDPDPDTDPPTFADQQWHDRALADDTYDNPPPRPSAQREPHVPGPGLPPRTSSWTRSGLTRYPRGSPGTSSTATSPAPSPAANAWPATAKTTTSPPGPPDTARWTTWTANAHTTTKPKPTAATAPTDSPTAASTGPPPSAEVTTATPAPSSEAGDRPKGRSRILTDVSGRTRLTTTRRRWRQPLQGRASLRSPGPPRPLQSGILARREPCGPRW
jgi:hypothetical protein